MGFWDPLLQQPSRAPRGSTLVPLTTEGDMLYFHLGANTRLPIGTAGQVLTVVAGDPSWQTPASTTPGGANGAVQFNLTNTFGGDTADFFWDHTNKRLGIGNSAPGVPLEVTGTTQTQTVRGNTTSAGTLTLLSTSNATKGKILLGAANSAYDEANVRLGIGSASPASTIFAQSSATGTVTEILEQVGSQTADVWQIQNSSGTVLDRVTIGGFMAIDVSGNATVPGTTALYLRGNSTTVNDILGCFNSGNTLAFRVTNTKVAIAPNQAYVGDNQSPAGTHTFETSGTALIAGTFATATTNGLLVQDNSGTAGVGIQGLDRRTDITSFKPLSLNANSPAATVYIGGTGPTTPGGGDVTLLKVIQNVSSGGAPMVDVPNNASYNPGSSPATTTCIRALNTMTRSAGTGAITNIGIRTGGTGAQFNRSLVVDNGIPRYTSAALTLANGVNDDIGEITSMFVRITGPSGAFSISSIRGGAAAANAPVDGDMVILYNTTSQAMTITNEAGTGTAVNRIHTASGADFVTTGEGVIFLIYDGTLTRWRDISSLP